MRRPTSQAQQAPLDLGAWQAQAAWAATQVSGGLLPCALCLILQAEEAQQTSCN